MEITITGDGARPHIHHDEDEALYVLEGDLDVRIGERAFRATAGSFAFVPRGVIQSYSQAGPEPAKILVIISPAGFEKLFEDIEDISGPPDADRIADLAAKYNVELVRPGK